MGLLDGKVAIITGGGKGIGFGIASAFAEQGASLFITGRTEGRLAEAAEKLKGEYGADVAYAVAEGSDEAQVEAAVEEGIDFIPADQVQSALQEAGIDDATSAVIVDDYEDASLKALKVGLLAAALLALVSLAFTGDLPHDPPSSGAEEDEPDREVALA